MLVIEGSVQQPVSVLSVRVVSQTKTDRLDGGLMDAESV